MHPRLDPMPLTAKGTVRRQAVVEAAAKLFRQRGFQGTSMDDIAASAKVPKGTIYHYFPGKAELLAQIYHDCIDVMLASYQDQPEDLDPETRVRSIISDMVRALQKNPDKMLVYVQEMQWLDKWLPRHRAAHIRKRESELWSFMEGAIGDAVRTGRFAPHDAFLTSMAMMGMVAWMPHWLSSTRRSIAADQAADLFADLLLDGLRPR